MSRMPPFTVAVPARFGSTRLPGKPLRLIAGRPMIVHVLERARASGAERVVVATDDQRIVEAVRAAAGEAFLTDPAHASGTDRIAEVAQRLGWPPEHIVVNLQGDEPEAPPVILDQVAALLAASPWAGLATLCAPVHSRPELFDPNVVKVVRDGSGRALYFSRAPVPWHRESFAQTQAELPAGIAFHRHIGIYAYRVETLSRFAALPPAPLETCESLEQLRALWHGIGIAVTEAVAVPPPGVDTEADLERAAAALQLAGAGDCGAAG
jgi:3-deoxy-manno-octulosonate cytidylyltransferase (CMP-KDO synthetase)